MAKSPTSALRCDESGLLRQPAASRASLVSSRKVSKRKTWPSRISNSQPTGWSNVIRSPAVHMGLAQRHDAISRVTPLLHSEVHSSNCSSDPAKPAADAFAAAQAAAPSISPRPRISAPWTSSQTYAPRVPPTERVLDELDVLLRHRPLSIPRRRGGCRPETARSENRRLVACAR